MHGAKKDRKFDVELGTLNNLSSDYSTIIELKEAFISAKKNPNHFDFDEYMSRYDEKIENYTMKVFTGDRNALYI